MSINQYDVPALTPEDQAIHANLKKKVNNVLSYFSRLLLRKQHLDLWLIRTEFFLTFMVAMTGGNIPHLIPMCSIKSYTIHNYVLINKSQRRISVMPFLREKNI